MAEAASGRTSDEMLLHRIEELLAGQAVLKAQIKSLSEGRAHPVTGHGQTQSKLSMVAGSTMTSEEHTQRIHFSGAQVTASIEEDELGIPASDSFPPEWPSCTKVRKYTGAESEAGRLAILDIRASSRLLPLLPNDEFQPKQFSFLLQPNGTLRILIDVVGILVLLYDIFVTPVVIAWNFQLEGWLYGLQVVVAIWWTLDLFFNLRTAYYKDAGELEWNPLKIFWRYLHTVLVLDLLFVVIDWIVIGVSGAELADDSDVYHTHYQAIRVIRFLKIWRIFKVTDILVRLSYKFDIPDLLQNTLSLWTPLFLLLWTCHIFACVFWVIGMGLFSSDTGHNWLEDGAEQYKALPFSYQYSTALHWTFMNLGTGTTDVIPRNTSERVFTMITNIILMLFLSWFIGNLFAALWNFRQHQAELSDQMQELRKFMRQSKISTQTALLVQRHAYDRLAATKPVTIADVTALNVLPQAIRKQLQGEMCAPATFKFGFFRLLKYIDADVMKDVMTECIDFLVSHDVIFKAGVQATTSYLVDFGRIEYSQSPAFPKQSLCSTKVADNDKMICEPAMWVHWTHVGTAIASTAASLLALDVDRIALLLSSQRKTQHFAAEYARSYHQRLTAAFPPQADWPDDLDVAATTFEEIITSLNIDVRVMASTAVVDLIQTSKPRDVLRHFNLIELIRQVSKSSDRQWSWPDDAACLMRDVQEGKCVLSLSEAGDVERLVAVAALKLKCAGGQILAELGSWDAENGLTVACMLPATPQRGGESPSDALERLLKQDLKPLNKGMELHTAKPGTTVQCWHSDKFRLRTKCLQTVSTAFYNGASDNHPDVLWMGQKSQLYDPEGFFLDIFGMVGKDEKLRLYAWISQHEFDSFCETKHGEDKLKQQLGLLNFGEDIILRIRNSNESPKSALKPRCLNFFDAVPGTSWQCLVM